MFKIFEFIALDASAFYFGSTAYITVVEHSAHQACSMEVALAHWRHSTKLTPRYAAAAIIAACAALVCGKWAPSSPWTWGTILLLSVLPVTVAFILPIQIRLAQINQEASPTDTRKLLRQWDRLHGLRTLLGACAFTLFLWATLNAT